MLSKNGVKDNTEQPLCRSPCCSCWRLQKTSSLNTKDLLATLKLQLEIDSINDFSFVSSRFTLSKLGYLIVESECRRIR